MGKTKERLQHVGIIRCLVLIVVSPTRLAYEYLKVDKSKDGATRFAARWPIAFFAGEAFLVIVLASTSPKLKWQIAAILGWLAASRIIEIGLAYYTDSMGSLRGDKKTTELGPVERIKFAMMSYGSLIFLWAFLYFALPLESFRPGLAQFIDALYFSGVTVTTLGYGDILPHSWYAKLLCIVEVLSGMLVLVLALASYLAGTSESRKA